MKTLTLEKLSIMLITLKYLERARTEALSTIGLSNLQIKDKFGALDYS